MKFFTKPLSAADTILITASDGAMLISVLAKTGAQVSILGGISFQGEQPQAIVIEEGDVFTFGASSPQSPLDAITVTVIAGNADLLIGF